MRRTTTQGKNEDWKKKRSGCGSERDQKKREKRDCEKKMKSGLRKGRPRRDLDRQQGTAIKKPNKKAAATLRFSERKTRCVEICVAIPSIYRNRENLSLRR